MMTLPNTLDAACHARARLQGLAAHVGGPLVALDTSTPLTSLAFVDAQHGVHELQWDASERPCVVLIDGLRTLAQTCGQRIDAIKALVVGVGPGSFTGLRVGLATAKGLSLGAQVPLYGASSLLMTAAEAGSGVVLALQDARRGELFAGLYQIDAHGHAEALMADSAIMPEALVAHVVRICTQRNISLDALRIVGHTASEFAALWSAHAHVAAPRALWALVACCDDIKAGRSTDAVALIPQYLRLSEPERQQLARQASM